MEGTYNEEYDTVNAYHRYSNKYPNAKSGSHIFGYLSAYDFVHKYHIAYGVEFGDFWFSIGNILATAIVLIMVESFLHAA